MASCSGTLMPFLYPCLHSSRGLPTRRLLRSLAKNMPQASSHRAASTESTLPPLPDVGADDSLSAESRHRRLEPAASDYARNLFTDKCTITIHAGSGGNGCVSFLREKYIAAGPPNGGDGGTGGNVYIQAVGEEKSLHKVARRGAMKAGRGRNGMGKSKGGQRGEDVVLQVPVGTVVTELARWDPVAEAEREFDEVEWREAREEEKAAKAERAERADMDGFGADAEVEVNEDGTRSMRRPTIEGDQRGKWRRDRWLLQPSSLPSDYATTDFPALPRPRRTNIAANQPPSPITLDLSSPTENPVLLAAGAIGGLGNPHFVTRSIPRPKFATKGETGMRMKLQLELKLLADLGFVGLPNAGKSTLLRALSNSRARVGNWAFTTLLPNIGTIVLDDNQGRAKLVSRGRDGQRRIAITVADIPGLVPGAHLDRGLGLDFLRHVERAKVLAFVVDLGNADAVEAVKGLWKELDMYEKLRDRDYHERSQERLVGWRSFGAVVDDAAANDGAMATGNGPILWRTTNEGLAPVVRAPPISEKPWFVVATKADLEGAQENYIRLKEYIAGVSERREEHPAGSQKKHRWSGEAKVIPVSAINRHGVERIVECTAEILSKD